MTMDTFSVQEEIQAYLATTGGFTVIDTIIPEAANEPVTANGYLDPYVVVRHNDSTKLPMGESFGGPRHDQMYMLTDCLAIAASPEEARELAYGAGGVNDILVEFKPVDAGPLSKAGGNVFTINDGTATKPTRYVARASFRCLVNMSPS